MQNIHHLIGLANINDIRKMFTKNSNGFINFRTRNLYYKIPPKLVDTIVHSYKLLEKDLANLTHPRRYLHVVFHINVLNKCI